MAADWLKGTEFAHRGLHGAPLAKGVAENSPAAFAGAVARGMGIECDVQLTADGEALVFHDFDLARLTGANGATVGRTLADLSDLRLLVGGEAPLSLPELLALVAGRVPLLIEIKTKRDWAWTRLCHAVAKSLQGYEGPFAIMSFDPRVVHWFRSNAPDILRGTVITEEVSRGRLGDLRRAMAFSWARPHFLAYDVRDLPSRFAAARRAAGVPVLTWTVRNPQLREVAHAHADSPIAEGEGVV